VSDLDSLEDIDKEGSLDERGLTPHHGLEGLHVCSNKNTLYSCFFTFFQGEEGGGGYSYLSETKIPVLMSLKDTQKVLLLIQQNRFDMPVWCDA